MAIRRSRGASVVKKVDVLVVGAGVVGAATALHLQMRGRSVALVDRRGAAGREASYGNAGLIQREAIFPYAFPRDMATLLRVAGNRGSDVHYHANALPGLAPFLRRYWHHSHPLRHARIARDYHSLIARCLEETRHLAGNAEAGHLLRPTGWLKIFRTSRRQDAELQQAEELQRLFGVQARPLDRTRLASLEPDIDPGVLGGLHYPQPLTVTDPGQLVDSYRIATERLGGLFLTGNAGSLRQVTGGWSVETQDGAVQAGAAVVALGAWSDQVTARLGYRFPLAGKRGYHMHFGLQAGVQLGRPVLDAERGYVLAPMRQGVRLTTGAEFARRDAEPTPVQIDRALRHARRLVPLGEALDSRPWMGIRPCLPDMLPIIGPAPRHRDLWLAFGHGHQGLTLGAITGRLIAESIVGDDPVVDLEPFRADRIALR
ncbi:NAD(P)/FAD-dependent oxidoreductase [Azospirillum sp. A23]|uniref:NAD(P)/FAD-dependent oxidoreductase n=1 Tax=Azospirillum sp. A23 TaxID=3160608 RepID=UPI0036F3FC39